MALGFIRYFAVTNDGPIGRAALAYLPSLLRIAPVRVISKSGQLEGAWRRFDALIMTPMAGQCVSCVCTHPSSWVWEQSVPMPSSNVGVQAAATATATAPSAPGGVAKGTVELYTPPGPKLLRNVLFVVDPPTTYAQRQTAAKYEAVLFASEDAARTHQEDVPLPSQSAYVDFVYQTLDHAKIDQVIIRRAVLGDPGQSQNPYR